MVMRKSAVRRKPKTKLGQFSRSYNHAAHALGVVAIVVVALAIVYRLLIIFRVQVMDALLISYHNTISAHFR